MCRGWRSALSALGVTLASFVVAACHDTGQVKVTSLDFHGVHAFNPSRLKDVLATQASGWLPWSKTAYFDRKEFDADLKRLIAYYADRGYPHARVTAVDVDLSQDKKSVRLSITVDEGQPLVVDRIVLTGFDVLTLTDQAHLRDEIPLRAGTPRDMQQLMASQDSARHMLRENGYAYATVTAHEGPTSAADHIVVEIAAAPGPKTYFGPIDISGLKAVRGFIVRRAMRFTPGEPYRESLVLASQRRITSLEVFDFVRVKTEPPAGEQPTSVPTLVTVTEARPRRLEVGLGYGTEDHLRASIEWRHLNMAGVAQQFHVSARWSSTIAGVSTDYIIPYPFRKATSAEASGYAWWSNAPAYDSQTYGGRINAVYRFRTLKGPHRRESHDIVLRAGYRNEFEKYQLSDSGAQDLTFSERIALGFDPTTNKGSTNIGSLSAKADYAALDHPADPQRGYTASLYGEHAAPWLGGTARFDEVRFELRGYYPYRGIVAAARAQIGTVTAGDVTSVPVSSRYYLGGTTTMRGWSRYEVAPLSEAGEPLGGLSVLLMAAEMRFPIRDAFSGVVFLDAGNVWSRAGEFHPADLRYDIGSGVRWHSPIGIVRADYGWQLTPIAGLRVDGEERTSRWRIQISIGHAF